MKLLARIIIIIKREKKKMKRPQRYCKTKNNIFMVDAKRRQFITIIISSRAAIFLFTRILSGSFAGSFLQFIFYIIYNMAHGFTRVQMDNGARRISLQLAGQPCAPVYTGWGQNWTDRRNRRHRPRPATGHFCCCLFVIRRMACAMLQISLRIFKSNLINYRENATVKWNAYKLRDGCSLSDGL